MFLLIKVWTFLFLCFCSGAQTSDGLPFYVSKRYQEKLEQKKRTGRGEVACLRRPSAGLLRHQDTEGQNWISFSPNSDTLYLRRCGLIRTENNFILADPKIYLND